MGFCLSYWINAIACVTHTFVAILYNEHVICFPPSQVDVCRGFIPLAVPMRRPLMNMINSVVLYSPATSQLQSRYRFSTARRYSEPLRTILCKYYVSWMVAWILDVLYVHCVHAIDCLNMNKRFFNLVTWKCKLLYNPFNFTGRLTFVANFTF